MHEFFPKQDKTENNANKQKYELTTNGLKDQVLKKFGPQLNSTMKK